MIPKDLKLTRTPVKLFSILFPRLTRDEAISYLVSQVKEKKGHAVCFPDMSTLNQVISDPKIGSLIEQYFIPLNDGVGLEIASKLERVPFIENLNGTDFVPQLFQHLPMGCKIFLIGAEKGVSEATLKEFLQTYHHLQFIGSHHGYMSSSEEESLIQTLENNQPDVVLVAMGNPLQLEWINKHKNNTQLSTALWLAVGGLFDFYGGTRVRAPNWMRKCRLEWLHIVWIQPKKLLRYFLGIPVFLGNTILKSLLRSHNK